MTEIELYIPQSRIPTSDCILASELRNLTWVAGGMSSYQINGEWHETKDTDTGGHLHLIVEDVEVRRYFIESEAQTAFMAGIHRTVAELKRLGEQTVLWTSTEREVHFA
jgi:hypothetical protein